MTTQKTCKCELYAFIKTTEEIHCDNLLGIVINLEKRNIIFGRYEINLSYALNF